MVEHFIAKLRDTRKHPSPSRWHYVSVTKPRRAVQEIGEQQPARRELLWRVKGGTSVKVDRASYVCEMTAAGAAVGAFVLVYVAGFAHAGVLLTLLVAWLPAAVFACLVARGVRQLMATLFQLDAHAGLAASTASVRPATIRFTREDDAPSLIRRERR